MKYKTIVSYLNGGYREILVLFGDKGSHYFEKLYQNTPSERMSLLEMCNHLTDNLIVKNKEGQETHIKG